MIRKDKIALFIKLFLAAFSFGFIVNIANADIYKCESEDGVTFYQEKPCPVKDKQTEMAAVKDPKGGYIAPDLVTGKEGENTSQTSINGAQNQANEPKNNSDYQNRSLATSNDSKEKVGNSSLSDKTSKQQLQTARYEINDNNPNKQGINNSSPERQMEVLREPTIEEILKSNPNK